MNQMELEVGGVSAPSVKFRHDAADTSIKAADQTLPRSGTQRFHVFQALAKSSWTDVELQNLLRMSPNTERPRRVELVDQGLVEDSGFRRKHAGRDHIVWQLTERGRRAWQT